MASCLILATLLLTTSFATTSDVSFTCTTRTGSIATGIGKTSQVSCNTGETMVSCTIKGWESIGGSWMENDVCIALSNYDEFQVEAEARCCTFPQDAILSTSIASSDAAQSVSSTCECGQVLTGCQVYYTSGAYGKIRGSFAGPFTDTPQTTAWIPTDNQCNAASYTEGTVKVGATCLTVNEGYALDCTTKAAFTTNSGFGSCEDGYTMMACNTLTDSHSLDEYYIKDGQDGNDICYIQQDDYVNMYGNAICCKLSWSSMPSVDVESNPFDCGCNEDCTIDCDAIDAHKGCDNAIIDGRKASSLNVICSSSKNEYFGGCQFASIYCPESSNSQCSIECSDYYGCYHSTIYSSSSYSAAAITRYHQNVSIWCMDVEGSCLKTILYANRTSRVDISCSGSGMLASKMHSSCDGFEVYIEDLSDSFNLLCSDDYSCYNMYIYANNAHSVSVHARGNYALSNSYIYATFADQLSLFCGSEKSEYGCYKVYLYNPQYELLGFPRTRIECQGHGCYDELYMYSSHGALDAEFIVNGCGECQDIASCISSWYFYCDSFVDFDIFHGDTCESDDCDCSFGMNSVDINWMNSMDPEQCDLFTYDYECESWQDCVIDCMSQWPNDNGCYDKAINGVNASSLHVICNSSSSASTSVYGACESVHIYCPLGDDARCDIECSNKDACYDSEISVDSRSSKNTILHLWCRNADSCSHTNVYSDGNAEISVYCIDTDACDNINVTANNAANITIHCEGNTDDFASYSACDGFTIWAENVTQDVQLICKGDYACYSIDIHANYANRVVVDSVGNYASYGGRIYGTNSASMLISCKSQLGMYGCYKMAFYIAQDATTLHCEGNGCHYLELYAVNGFTDLSDIQINGCDECSDIASCVSKWQMYCGKDFATSNIWSATATGTAKSSCVYDANCGCSDSLLANAWMDDVTSCNVIAADYECEADEACVVDCSTDTCDGDVIVGASATSLHVICDENACVDSKIYCPTTMYSSCNITCSGDRACSNAQIFGAITSVLKLECNGYDACSTIELDVSETFLTNVTCDYYASCNNIEMYGDAAHEIVMNCVGQSTGYGVWDYYYYYSDWNATHDYEYHTSVCESFVISVTNTRVFSLYCTGNDACYPSSIVLDNTQNASIYGIGSFSIYGGEIHAENTEHLLLHFEGGDEYGVEYVSIYLPPSKKTRLSCLGYGCDSLSFYTEHGMSDVGRISFDTCAKCVKPEICIRDWNLYCGDGYATSVTYSGSFCDGDDNACDCADLRAQIEEAFIADIEMEDAAYANCNDDTFTADIECTPNKDCVIDCDDEDCVNKEIYGGLALSLTVLCDAQFVCHALQMYCPETSDSQCNLLCNGFDACYYTTLYGDHHNIINIEATQQYAFEYSTVYGYDSIQLNVNCSATESCYSSHIYASAAHDVNVLCYDDGMDGDEYDEYHWYYYEFWNYTSTSPCYELNIYASAVQNDLQLICNGDYACYGTNLYAEHANHVTIRGDNGEYGMKDANIYVSNVTLFELTCIGSRKEHGCSEAHMYLPHASRVSINCYGYGCDKLFLYAANGVSGAPAIEFNSCGFCPDLNHCIESWFIYCDSWSEYDVHTVYDGDECGSISLCGCQTLASAIVESTESCDALVLYPTFDPTVDPTVDPTRDPTLDPTFNPTHDPTLDPPADPTTEPTHYPTDGPTSSSNSPSGTPTDAPSIASLNILYPTFLTVTDTGDKHHHGFDATESYHHGLADNTASYYGNSQVESHSHAILLFMICIAVVMVCCVIGNAIYCYKRRVTEKIAAEILQQVRADEGGINEIALEPMDHNIGQQIIRVNNVAPQHKANIRAKRKYVKMDDEDGSNTGGITTWSFPK